MSDTTEATIARLHRFANTHKVVLEDQGEVGFGRPCVGFLHGDSYLDYRPLDSTTYEPLPGFDGLNMSPPAAVPDAYHKHDCLAVLVRNEDYDEALRQLAAWVDHMEAAGPLEVVRFATGATGLQAIMSGVFGYAIRVKSHDSTTVAASSGAE